MAPKKETSSEGPRRNLSGYQYFCQEMRSELKSEHPDMKASEVMSELGRRWKAASAEERKPFEAKAAEDKLRYNREKEEMGITSVSRKRKTSDNGKEKTTRTSSAYNLFVKKMRPQVVEENPDMENKHILGELGRRWSALDASEKAPYEEEAKKLKENAPPAAPKAAKRSSTRKPRLTKTVESEEEMTESEDEPAAKRSRSDESEEESEED
ncbi:hypothetical protein RCL1_005291 [Eukaryota sp. TZLM3-RCL]